MTFRQITIRCFIVLALASVSCYGQGQIFPGSNSSAAIACIATPGNTRGAYRQQCQTSAGAVYACNNSSGCTVAADWVAAGGAQGPGYSATSTASLTIGTGAQTLTTQSGLAYTAGALVIVSDSANTANYMIGTVTSYSGGTMVVNVTLTGGSGTFATWNINLVGLQGATGASGSAGAAGAGYAATSITSLTIGTGSTSFATQSGLAYSAGARARAAYSSNTADYMEGLVTSYSGTTLVINVDTVGGSGTFASWNVNLAGNVGQTGGSGTNGTNGTNGAGYTATSSTSLAIGTGTIGFTTQSGLAYVPGSLNYASACSSAAPTACFFGTVTSYSGTSLTLAVTSTSGSGTHSDWLISVSGAIGGTGATGPSGASGLQSGTVTVETGSYSGTAGDAGKLFKFTGASSTYTLPASLPTMPYLVGAYSANSTGLTISGNGNSILTPSGSVLSFTVAEYQGVTCFSDTGGTVYICMPSSGGSSSGGVNAQTTNYTAVAGDQGKLVTMNGSSLTWTAPASPPSSVWFALVENLNATPLTTSPNGLLVNSSSASLPTLLQGQWEFWYTDGTNYSVYFPPATGSGITTSCAAPGVCTWSLNTVIGASVTNIQEGNVTTVFSANGTSTYTGCPANGSGGGTGTVLTSGMNIDLIVDVTNTSGSATLNYCTLGPIAIKDPDGSTDPWPILLPVGSRIPLQYNGSVFILPAWLAYSEPPEIYYAGTGGVTASTLVIADTSTPAKMIAATGTGAYGIALASAAASAAVQVLRYGRAYCVADNNVTAGDLIIPGTSTVIDCRDSGQTSSSAIPVGTRIIGTALTSASSAATFVIELTPAHYGTQLNTYSTLTDGTAVAWAIGSATYGNAQLTFTATGGSRTLNVTGMVAWGQYVLKLVQGSSGSEGLTLGSGCTWKVAGGGSGAVTLSTGANAVDVLGWTYDGTNCLAVLQKNFD